MASHAIDSWTFSGLVGAFLDLSLAFLLLCGSTLAFFAAKFLSFFGLYLPCPCNGLFGYPNDNPNCLRKLLVDLPTSKISSVQLSVKNKFPFDSILMRDPHRRYLNAKLLKDAGDPADGFLEMEGETSCSSFSDVGTSKKSDFGVFRTTKQGLLEGKEKGILNHRPPRSGALRRRRRSMIDRIDSSRWIKRNLSRSPLRSSQEICKEEDDKESQAGYDSSEGTLGESKILEKEGSSSSEVGRNAQRDIGYDRSEEGAIRVLEQALEEEHAARASLCRELEKERSAAASAADEAMAMILRLQEEKATIEMEARQYQRMIEEKSEYDAEEMNILKEIIVRREREKHFLEKEVESYRQMMSTGNEQLEMYGERPISSSDPNEDPMLMLQQISESISKKEVVKNMNKSDFDEEKQGRVLAFGEDSPSSGCSEAENILKRGNAWESVDIEKVISNGPDYMDECRQEFQEKEIVSMKQHSSASKDQEMKSEDSRSQDHNSFDKATAFVNEEQEKNDEVRLCQGKGMEIDTSFPCAIAYLEKHGRDADQDRRDQHSSTTEAEPSVLDVHVIDDKSGPFNQENPKASGSLLTEATPDRFRRFVVQSEAPGSRKINASRHQPSTSRGNEPDICRSRSDMSTKSDISTGLDKSLGEALLFDLRRNSMSTAERLKLGNEVEWLRERLKIVQEGRERLSFSVEHREREKFHLQLLEDIARHLQEIRQLTEPGRSVRQASLPPLSSKVSSKKRRYRSGSWGVHGSS